MGVLSGCLAVRVLERRVASVPTRSTDVGSGAWSDYICRDWGHSRGTSCTV